MLYLAAGRIWGRPSCQQFSNMFKILTEYYPVEEPQNPLIDKFLCSSETSIGGFWCFKIGKCLVGVKLQGRYSSKRTVVGEGKKNKTRKEEK